MNYLSHFYFFNKPNTPYYNCGLVFPDWLGAYKRKRLSKNLIIDTANEQELAAGIEHHFLGDRIFHGSEYFKEHAHGIKLILEKTSMNKDLFRFSFISHVILEMMIDRLLLLKHPHLGTQFYDNLDACDDTQLLYFAQRNSSADEGFKTMVEKFKHYRFILGYVNTGNFVYSLNRIIGRVGINFNESQVVELTAVIPEIENYIDTNWNKLFILFDNHEK